jgi:hypothetical protein
MNNTLFCAAILLIFSNLSYSMDDSSSWYDPAKYIKSVTVEEMNQEIEGCVRNLRYTSDSFFPPETSKSIRNQTRPLLLLLLQKRANSSNNKEFISNRLERCLPCLDARDIETLTAYGERPTSNKKLFEAANQRVEYQGQSYESFSDDQIKPLGRLLSFDELDQLNQGSKNRFHKLFPETIKPVKLFLMTQHVANTENPDVPIASLLVELINHTLNQHFKMASDTYFSNLRTEFDKPSYLSDLKAKVTN